MNNKIRPRCPECGGRIYPDTDREWGDFGQMSCPTCGWDDGMRIDPASLILPHQHPGIGMLTRYEQMVLAWIIQAGHPFKAISIDVDEACEALSRKGFALEVSDNGETCYVAAPGKISIQ